LPENDSDLYAHCTDLTRVLEEGDEYEERNNAND
jgi:hypothetical protein